MLPYLAISAVTLLEEENKYIIITIKGDLREMNCEALLSEHPTNYLLCILK
jgi:hypothetical protein